MYAVCTLSILSISRSPVHLPHKNKNLPESPSEKTKVSSSYFPLNLKKFSKNFCKEIKKVVHSKDTNVELSYVHVEFFFASAFLR